MSEQDSSRPIIQQVHGLPSKPSNQESSLFEAFKKFFLPRLRKQEVFAVAYEEANLKKLDAEGEKIIQEAAKLAAEKDIARQQELKAYCENIDKFFSAEDPPQVMMLKLAKFIEVNPEIGAQLDRVNSLVGHLNRTKSLQISFKDDDNVKLPEPSP